MKRVAATVLALLAACATEEPVEVGYGDMFGTPENPVPHEAPYAVTTRIDVDFDPAQVAAATADLKAFAQNPARALLSQGSGSSLQQLQAALNTALEDRLEGWLNTEIDKRRLGGKTLRQLATDVAGFTEVTLTQFALESSLAITPTGATHVLHGLNFRPSGLDIIIPLGGLKADAHTQATPASVGHGGTLMLGEQRFSIDFGPHAWHALNLASATLYGAELETTLAGALDCRALAQVISTRCYNGACVGNAPLVEAVCEAGTSAIVDELAAQVGAFEISSFRLIRGSGRLVDDNFNGEAERILDGRWEAEVDVGAGVRPVAATFEALQ